MRRYIKCLPADFGLENDWAALDSPLCYSLLAVDIEVQDGVELWPVYGG